MKMHHYKQKTMPLVSIIIPCHNSIKSIERCLLSCLNQTYSNIEILLIENNSSDQTWELCKSYANEYQGKVFAYQSRFGGMAGAARNLGIDKSNGDYLTFLDDDDDLHLEAIEILLEHALKNNADVTNGGISVNNHITEEFIIKKEFRLPGGVFSSDRFKLFYLVAGHARLIKKSFIIDNTIRYQEDLPICNDFRFYIKLFIYAQIVVNIPENLPLLHNYEVTDDSSVRNRDKYINNYPILFRSVFNELNIAEKSDMFKNTILNNPTVLKSYKEFIFTRIVRTINYELTLLAEPSLKTKFIELCVENNVYNLLDAYRTENNLNIKHKLNLDMAYYKQKNKPLVSIIIPCHNSVKYLERSLTSCLNQTYPNIEVLLIENASSDQTFDLCNYYSNKHDGRVFAYQSRIDGFSGAAKNLGIDKANGEYLLFLDDDDYLHLEAIELLLEYCIGWDADIAGSKFRRKEYGKNDVIIDLGLSGLYQEDSKRSVGKGTTHGKIYKTRFINEFNIRFEEERPLAQDNQFYFFANLLASKIAVLPNYLPTLYIYEVQSNSQINTLEKNYFSLILTYEDILKEFDSRINDDKQKQRLLGNAYNTNFEDAALRGIAFFMRNTIVGNLNFFEKRMSLETLNNYELLVRERNIDLLIKNFNTRYNLTELDVFAHINKIRLEKKSIKRKIKHSMKMILLLKRNIKHSIKMVLPPAILIIAKKILGKK